MYGVIFILICWPLLGFLIISLQSNRVMFRTHTRRTSRRQRNNFSDRLGRTFSGRQNCMNILSAILGTTSIVLLCASLVEPNWFGLDGGECCLSYLGIYSFFGHFTMESLNGIKMPGSCEDGRMSQCINFKALTLMHVIIGFCLFAIGSSLFSFLLDVVAPKKRPLWKALKRYAIGYIFTVLNSATVVGFAYWASQEMYELQFDHKQHPGSKVEVTFGSGVYLVTAAGGLAILATAANLLRQYPTEEEEQAEQLLYDLEDDDEDGSAGLSSEIGFEPNPPPPYIP